MSRIVFVTYYRLVPTAQVGVLKRCLRIVPHLAPDHDIHLVNFGPFPKNDPVVRDAAGAMTHHPVSDDGLGDNLWSLFGDLDPDTVVLGETPLRGSMRLAHRVATRRGLRQIVIENHYAAAATRFLDRIIPAVDGYLLLGLGPDDGFEPLDPRHDLTPPLVRLAGPVSGATRDRICIVGYDRATLAAGLALVGHLPADLPVDIFTLPPWRHLVDDHAAAADARVRVVVNPDDAQLHGALASAQVVFGKAGFQQVVEALLLGARVVCRIAGGGIEPYLLPDHLLPHVAFLRDDEGIPAVAAQVRRWLGRPPVTTWLPVVQRHHETASLAAARLGAAIGGSR